jgi:hypothetical protein
MMTDEEKRRDEKRRWLVDRLQAAQLRYALARHKVLEVLPPDLAREVLEAKQLVERMEQDLYTWDFAADERKGP